MKKYLLFLMLTFLMGCTGATKYQSEIKIIQEPQKLAKITIEKKEMLENAFGIFPKEISMNVENLTEKPLNIIWEESSINNNPIFKNGMKYKDAGISPPKTILFPKSNENIEIYDSSKISFSSSGWGIASYQNKDFPLKLIITVEQEGEKEMLMTEITKLKIEQKK